MANSRVGNSELKRHNHYLPEMYLKQWSQGNKLFEYRLLVSHENVPIWTAQSLGSVASYDNLYIHIKRGEEYDDIEQFFDMEFESPAKEPLEKACVSGKLSADAWHRIISFVCAQHVRTPAYYHMIRNMMKENASEIIQEAVDSLENINPEQIPDRRKLPGSEYLPISLEITDIHPDKDHTLVGVNIMSGKGVWFFGIIHMLQPDSEFMLKMKGLKWSIITASDEVEWPISDNPLIITEYNNNQFTIFQDGIARKNVFLFFPISPKIVLVASEKRFFGYRYKAGKALSLLIKEMIVKNAFNYIYSRTVDDSIPEIRKRVVDKEAFDRIKAEYERWYQMYKDEEVPILRERENK